MPDEREFVRRLDLLINTSKQLIPEAKEIRTLGKLGEVVKEAAGERGYLDLLDDFYRHAREAQKEGLKLYFGQIPLTVLELPSQDLLTLQRIGITTIPQVLALSILELAAIKNFGSTRTHRLIHRLSSAKFLPQGTTLYHLLENYPALSIFEAGIRIKRERW